MIIYIYDAELPHTCCSGHGLMRLLCAVLRLMRSFLMMHAYYLAGEGYRGRGCAAYKPERAHAIDLLPPSLSSCSLAWRHVWVPPTGPGAMHILRVAQQPLEHHACIRPTFEAQQRKEKLHHNDDMYACPSRSSLHILGLGDDEPAR